MTDEQRFMQENGGHPVSPSTRSQRLVEYLGELWQHSQEPSSETLKRVTAFVVSLDETQRTAGLTAIADHIANNLILHFLDTMAVFQQKAEREGIGLQEREEYLRYILTELFPKIVGLNRFVSVQSLDALVTLSSITHSLQTLSDTDTAEAAQSWMYELPTIYPSELLQENLVATL